MCLELEKIVKPSIAKEDIECYKYLLPEMIPAIEFHGKKFSGSIRDTECTGAISINKSNVFFCTDEIDIDGRNCANKLGYKYSWVFDDNVEVINVDGVNVTDKMYTDGYVTPYQREVVEIGKTYISDLDTETNNIEIGLHSFVHFNNLPARNENVFVKCIIPKGSQYYKGKFDFDDSYASDKLTYVEIIK